MRVVIDTNIWVDAEKCCPQPEIDPVRCSGLTAAL